ncbi:2OG-Fe(II) oxygenase family protein [Thalassotalea atypica]|uniref:2OG-Fe(II) oxygenase family protein n=1 Tax=Thalassotalea atypica TaxID=2054316 RepID=UPI0025735FBF|nr:tetratricopeptide repeat protein [Thalassotalea atypica]
MNLQRKQQLAIQLQQLSKLLQQKSYQQVITGANKLIHEFPKQSDLYHLLALAYKGQSQFDAAIKSFEQSLSINPNQSAVHNNFANCLLGLKQFDEALNSYNNALKLQPNFFDALKNSALAYFEKNMFKEAEGRLRKALALKKNDPSVLTQLGNIYKAQESFEHAIKYYQQALNIDPNYINALHNMGLAYKLSEQLNEALVCFNKARAINPNIPEVEFNTANTLFEQGRYQQAEQFYWSALNKNPKAIDVHSTLNEFYWQTGKKDSFGHSFRLALEHLPTDMDIHYAYIDSLINANKAELAQVALTSALSIEKTPKLLKTKGILLAQEKNNSAAIEAFEQSLNMSFKVDVALDLIGILIVEYEYERAQELVAKVEKIAPYNQLLIAYKSLCWRLVGDDRYQWLIDYQRFVRGYQIPTPKGYQSLPAFLKDLEHVLLSMHNTKHEPLKQTLKHGTQTPGRLLYKPHPVISALKQSLSEVVNEHISNLPDDNNHPLLSRKANAFEFSGSWSVKLKPQGFHVNHVHPAGWLSSSFYVNMPDFTKVQQTHPQAGAIKFGESSLFLGDREKIERIIEPKAGTLALFPSYVWHGTIAFNGLENDYRLTSPFDVVPV